MEIETFGAVAARLRAQAAQRQASGEPRPERPAGSRWSPGMPGKPDCPICRGTGYLRMDVKPGHPQFGRVMFCDCAADNLDAQAAYRRAALLARSSGLGDSAMSLRWETIRPGYNPSLNAAVDAIRETLERGYGWVYLWGPPGVGKTLALQVAVAESAANGRAAAWVELPDMLGALRSAYAQNEHETRVNDWRSVPVLALDEMGRANETAWSDEVEHRILSYRYSQAMQERRGVTLFAANYGPEHLSDALVSRVHDRRNVVCHVTGRDMRQVLR